MDVLTAPVPWWPVVVLCLLAALAMWLVCRTWVTDANRRAEAAEREAQWAVDRAETAQQAADAVTRALPAWPEPVCGTLTTRGGGLGWDSAYDVYPDDDDTEPERSGESVPGDPPGEQATSQTTTFGAAILPRYDWAHTGWAPGRPAPSLPPPAGVLARGYGWPGRLVAAAGGWLRRALAYPGQRLAAAQFEPADESPWAAGELTEETTVLPVIGRAAVPQRKLPRSYLPVHVWGRSLRMVSAAAVLGATLPVGPPGMHRSEVAPGALGQRPQFRQFALPAGAR